MPFALDFLKPLIKKVVASDSIWQDAFGGMTNKPGTNRNADGGIKYGSLNLTQMDLHNLDTTAIADMSALFNGGSNLTTVGDLSDWNTSNVNNMHTMFQRASSLTDIGNLDNWDTSKVTDMSWMFGGTTNLTNIGDLSKWQTGNVTDMHNMFANATNLTNIGNLNDWDTNKVTDMSWMFGTDFDKQSHLTNIGDLSKWQTGNVTNMNSMFYNATNLTNIGDLNNWNTSKVTDMHWMFGTDSDKQSHLTNIGDLSKWQTGNVTDMHNMFANATNLTNIGNLNDWDTSKVTDMSWMFCGATNLTNIGDLSKWQTGNVTDMHNMFANATNLTNIGNLNDWDTSKVTDMNWMFGTDSDKQSHLANIGDLSKWQAGNVTDMNNMFANATNLTNIGNLDNWDTSKVTDMNWMFGGTTNLTNIGDLSKWQTGDVTNMSYMFINATNLTNIGDLSKWNTSKVTNMRGMFYNAKNLTNIGNLDNWNTSKVTDMSWMFGSATNLTNIGDLSKWQTGNVINMHSMFDTATSLTNIGNLDNWDTNKVTDMGWMFGTESGKQSHLVNIGDLANWNTSNVTNMSYMFYNATNLTNIGNLDNWNTSKVTDMSWMFSGTTSLTNIGNLTNWDTSKVTNMTSMFSNATNLTNIGNLDNWDTGNVTDMNHMFHYATNLTNIGDLSKWQTGNVTNMNAIFMGLEALHRLNISNWNLTKLANKDAMKYMFASDFNSAIIANNLKLPNWYQNEVNNADYFWDNHMAVITNVPELIKATGDINNLKIDKQNASRSIFYDSKGSSDAIKVLTDANNQYIADYHKANPTKALKLADTVDINDPIALANASFVTIPKEFNLTVHFEDVDPNRDKDSDSVKQELAKTVELSGNKGDTADLSQVQLPTNFELSGDLPSATFGDTDSVTIRLKHKLSDNKPFNQNNGDAVASTNVVAPDGTVLIHGEVRIDSFIDQRQDLVTGKMVNGNTRWSYNAYSQTNVSSDILNKYIEQYNPAIMYDKSGYSNDDTSTESWYHALGAGLQQPLQIKLKAGYAVDRHSGDYHGWDDWSNNTYTYIGLQGADDWNTAQQLNNGSTSTFQIVPLDQSVHYQFMDNGTQVGSNIAVTGKTDETVSLNLSIPENYELADGTTLPTSYTFAATNPTIQINLKHKTETSIESLPATRTITVHLPNGTTKVYQQVIGYQRNVITDLVAKTVTRGTWTMNEATSSFTIDGVKQQENSYVLRNGNYNFASIKLPKMPGYKAETKKVANSANSARTLFIVNFMALPKPATPTPNDVKLDKTVTPKTVVATEVTESVKTESKVTVSVAPKVIDLSNDTVATAPKEATWQIANESDQNIYRVSNGKYTVELPHIDNAQLHVIANNSTKDSVLFTYKGQNTKYVFNIKFVDGHYLLTTYEIKLGKLVKANDYNFVNSTKISDFIKNWLKL